MGAVIGLAASAIALSTPAKGQASDDYSKCKPIEGGERAGYICPWGFTATRGGIAATRRSSSGAPRPQARVVYVDDVGVGPDGESCLRTRAVPLPEGTSLAPGTDFGNISGPIFSTYPRCPAEPGEVEVIDPRVLAQQGWEEVLLPKPQPYIAPGWAITGKYAYLETRGELRDIFTKATPIGPLEITSTGRYYVDWGDGERTGPHSVEGGPWPDGEITHTYIDVGHYDVVVTEEWTATWRLGPASGSLSGQQTVGRIDDFRVEQIQVVVGP